MSNDRGSAGVSSPERALLGGSGSPRSTVSYSNNDRVVDLNSPGATETMDLSTEGSPASTVGGPPRNIFDDL